MSGIGAASFVEGLQGGIAARDTMDRNKQFKQMRKLGIADATQELRGKRIQGMANQKELLGDDFSQEDFDAEWGAFEQDKDPALMRFGKFLGGKMKGMFGGGGEEESAQAQMAIATPSIDTPKPGAVSGGFANGGIVPRGRYADGGMAEESDEEKRARYAAMTERDEDGNPVTTGGGMGAFAGDVGRNVMGNTRRRMSEWAPEGLAADQAVLDAEGAEETGDAVRRNMGSGAKGIGQLAAGLAEDTGIPQAIGAIGRFGKGFLGFDGGGEGEGIPAGQQVTDVPSTPEGDAIGATVDNPDVPAEQTAQKAIKEASDDNVANYDYKLLVDQNVRPEDLPSMSTKDWSGYRERMTTGAIMRGQNPVEAHKMVDDRITQTQMAGFQREGNKAVLYLQSGQNREAAMALRQAYQYFPNGVSVKFGTMIDPKTGQPAIMTMGTDEETGEPTGSPMLITTERLTTMMENMSNPSAFRTWTKDGRDLQVKINQLQSQDDYRQGSLEISAYNAETSRMAGGSGAGGGGMSDSERRQRDQVYAKAMSESGFMEKGFEDPSVTRALASAMSMFERLQPGLDTNTVMNEVMSAYQADPENGVQQLLEDARGQ